MNNRAPRTPSFLTNVGIFILVVAIEAAFLTFVWNHAVVGAFDASKMMFGHMFTMVFAFKFFFRDMLKLGEIHYVLKQIREIQYFVATSSERKKPEPEEKPNPTSDTDK